MSSQFPPLLSSSLSPETVIFTGTILRDGYTGIAPLRKVGKVAQVADEVAKETTVIGHLPEYVEVAEKMGANYLKPTLNWNWRTQGNFIKDVIKSGDNVFIGTSIRKGPSVLKHEIKQLIKAGYEPIELGSKWLIKRTK